MHNTYLGRSYRVGVWSGSWCWESRRCRDQSEQFTWGFSVVREDWIVGQEHCPSQQHHPSMSSMLGPSTVRRIFSSLVHACLERMPTMGFTCTFVRLFYRLSTYVGSSSSPQRGIVITSSISLAGHGGTGMSVAAVAPTTHPGNFGR